MDDQIEIKAKAFEVIEKIVKPAGGSGRVYVPKDWVGLKVKVLLLESSENNEVGKNAR